MNLHLTNKEFEEAFGYSYDKLKIKLETSKDSENLERLIIIKDLSDLKNISNSIKEVSYSDGYKDAKYYYTIELSSKSI